MNVKDFPIEQTQEERTLAAETAPDPGAPPPPPLPERPLRAVGAAGLLAAGWLLLAGIQLIFRSGLAFSAVENMFLAMALFGMAVYLVVRRGWSWKFLGFGVGLASSLLLTASELAAARARMAAFPEAGLGLFFDFRHPEFVRHVGNNALLLFLCLGAALLMSLLYRKTGKGQTRLCAGTAAVLYLLIWSSQSFFLRLAQTQFMYYGVLWQFLQRPEWQCILRLMPVIALPLVVYLGCMAVYALCYMSSARVKLHGLGLVWAWLALAGSLVTIVATIAMGVSVPYGPYGVRNPWSMMYASQLLVGIGALLGYLLLLLKKRAGLYVILLSVGLMLGADFVRTLSEMDLRMGIRIFLLSLLPMLFSALNPLFAWLAVRAGREERDPEPSQKS